MIPGIALAFLAGVAFGSVPFAWIVIRITHGVDLSRSGSGNVGAFNSLKVSKSKRVGLSVLVLDLLKGAAAGAVGLWLAGRFGVGADVGWGAATVGVLVGHVYNPWLRFKGGKGFAALAGAAFVHAPWLVACWFGTFWLVWALFRSTKGIVDEAPSSLVATLLTSVFAYAIYGPSVSLVFALTTLIVLPRLWPEVRDVLSGAPDGPDDASDETTS